MAWVSLRGATRTVTRPAHQAVFRMLCHWPPAGGSTALGWKVGLSQRAEGRALSQATRCWNWWEMQRIYESVRLCGGIGPAWFYSRAGPPPGVCSLGVSFW